MEIRNSETRRRRMSEFVEVPGGSDLKNGEMKMFKLGDHEFLLARVADTFYAADNRCPHMSGNLSAGKLEKTVVTCPRHHSQFDLVDGHVLRWTDYSGFRLSLAKMMKSPRPVKTYKTKAEGGKVMVEVDKATLVSA
jgi:3-phenylpropionate/trans-cinnamate dioxygenase ferredoxin subunit